MPDPEPTQAPPTPDVLPPTGTHEGRAVWPRTAQATCFVAAGLAAAFTAWHVAQAAIDVPFWDDFDSTLGFLVSLDDADGIAARMKLLLAFNNEHRTVVGRAVFWMAHVLGGSIDFRILTLVSAAILVSILGLVTLPVRDSTERAGAVLITSAFLFNLQHYESLFWGGAGLEHLGVVAFALAALVALGTSTRVGLIAAGVCALAAMLTLAHGFLVVPAGALVLASQRRWRTALAWLAGGGVVAICWMYGYPQDGRMPPTAQATTLARFWLGLLGAPLSFGSRLAAPWIGAGIVTLAVLGVARGWFRHRLLQIGMLAFLAGSLLLITVGRAGMDPNGFMVSRYRILSGLIIALLVWATWCRAGAWPMARAWQLGIGAITIGLMLEQGSSHAWRSAAYHVRRATAAAWYAEHGTLEGSPVVLYYDVPKADRILRESARHGIHDLAAVGRTCPAAPQLPRAALGGGEVSRNKP